MLGQSEFRFISSYDLCHPKWLATISKDLRGTRRHQEAARGPREAPGRQTRTLMTMGGARRSSKGAQEALGGTFLFSFLMIAAL